MTSAALKDIVREIKNSRNRFLAIMVLSALAVAFLCGLKVTAPDMKGTGDAYLDEQRLMDIQVMSTLGITDEDIAELDNREETDYAIGAYVMDAWTGDAVAKVYSITENVNRLVLMEGNMPVVSRECVMDAHLMAKLGLSIGDYLPILPSEDNEDSLIYDDFRIVGTVRSPYYVSVERGSASIGSGSVQGYVYLKDTAFNMDCYTIAYLGVKGAENLTAFTDEYDDYIEDVIDALEPVGEVRAQLRHDEIIDEAMDEIADAEQELADAEREVAEEIAEAERELADARRELDDGWYAYRKGKAELEDAYCELLDGEEELCSGYYELLDGEDQYEEGLEEYQDGLAAFEAEYEKQYPALERAKAEIDEGLAAIELYKSNKKSIEQGIAECKEYLKYLGGLEVNEENSQEIQQAIAQTQAQLGVLIGNLQEIDAQAQAMAALEQQLNEAVAKYEEGLRQLNEAKAAIEKGKAELDDARKELNKGWQEYYNGRQELKDGWNEYYEGLEELPKARKKLNDGEKEYEEGLIDLEEGRIEAAEEIADAREKLADARREVAEIEECEWYILPRGYNPGYTGFGQDAERMANLATVFPVIFFLVAGLVCLTTMTRMVEEHRTEIGLMKALGYGKWTISAKYLSYGLLPSFSGGMIGLVIGHTLFPAMIYISYQIMYEMPNIILRVYPGLSLMSVLAVVACTTVSTMWACMSTLADSPANLMRPRAPKAGKRVLLERISPLWKRMSFNWKITSRNLFRYQKRFWMTVIGIGGCTALVIAGVGLRDSLTMSMRVQYDELFNYDAQLTYAEGLLDEERQQVIERIIDSDEISAYSEMYAASVTAKSDAYSISAYLEVFDPKDIAQFITLRDYETKADMPLPPNGVLIDIKLSELLQLDVGDGFIIDSDGMHEAVVAGIYENYVGHFIYLAPRAYSEIFGGQCEKNGIMLNLEDDSRETCERVTTELLMLNGISSAMRAADTQDTYLKSMERVDFVVVVIILCAAALAVVVLYNLSNINMTERMRELATIKVLGFYDGEVSAYVYRENIVLTIVGIGLGCLMGKYLHSWMIRSVEIDVMMFAREVTASCYGISAGLTALFSAAVNILAHKQMKGINMVESLKSAE